MFNWIGPGCRSTSTWGGTLCQIVGEESHDVFFDLRYVKDVDPKLIGTHGAAFIKLKESAMPKKELPFLTLEVRDEELKAKIQKSIANGPIVPCPATELGARAFLVLEPGNPMGAMVAQPTVGQCTDPCEQVCILVPTI